MEAAGGGDCPTLEGAEVGGRLACAWALVDFAGCAGVGAACCFDAAAGAAVCAGASGVMMLTGGIAAEFAKSTEVGRPTPATAGMPVSRPAAGDAGAAAALVQDAE